MKLAKRVLAAAVAGALALLALALTLPGHYRVERRIAIHAAPDRVYALIAAPRAWARWSVWTRRDPGMRIVYRGPAAGIGANWSWDSRSEGRGTMLFTDAVVGEGVRYALRFPDLGTQGDGELRLRSDGRDTLVTWTHEGETGPNPALRLMAPFMDRILGPDFESGLRMLKQVAEAG